MKVNAYKFSQLTKVVLVGVNDYRSGQLVSLKSPEKDVEAIHKALTEPGGCNIPIENINTYTGSDAKKGHLLTEIRQGVEQLDRDECLIFYFAGHGMVNDGMFYLCLSDTSLSDLAGTAVSSLELDESFSGFAGRGLLFILDCCQSASFAELTPSFFRRLGSSEYKILLSASHSDASSWELADGGGTLFTNNLVQIIQGKGAIGDSPGFIYFSDLFEYLQFKMAEDLKLKFPELAHQEPIFSGVYSKNPLIFLHKNLTLGQVKVKTAKYSREYIIGVLRRVAASLAILLIFATGLIYTINEKTQYAKLENNRISVFQGYPGWDAFGFPRQLWTTSIESEWTKSNSILRDGGIIVSKLGHPVQDSIYGNLKPEFRAMYLLWQGKKEQARELLLRIINSGELPAEEMASSIILFTHASDLQDTSRLKDWINNSTVEDIRNNALMAFVRVSPDMCVELVTSNQNLNLRAVHEIVLRNLEGAATQTICRYFNWLMAENNFANRHPSLIPDVINKALELNCKIDTESLLKAFADAGAQSDARDIVNYAVVVGDVSFQKRLVKTLQKIPLGKVAQYEETFFLIGNIFYALSLMPDVPWDAKLTEFLDGRFSVFSENIVRANLMHGKQYRAAIFSRINDQLKTMKNREKISLAETLCQNNLLSSGEVLDWLEEYGRDINKDDFEIGVLMDAASKMDLKEAVPLIRPFLKSATAANKQKAIQSLDALGDREMLPAELLVDNDTDVQAAAYEWYYKRNPDLVFESLLNRFDQETIGNYLPRLIQGKEIPQKYYDLIKDKLSKSPLEKSNATTVFAISGTIEHLIFLINHPNPFVREKALDYIAYNEALGELVKSKEIQREYPDFSIVAVDRQLKLKEKFRQHISKIPYEKRRWFIDLLYRTRRLDVTKGLILWLGTRNE